MKCGYVEVVTLEACTLFPPHCTVRGHVFHYSEILQEHVVGGFSQVCCSRGMQAKLCALIASCVLSLIVHAKCY